MYVSIWHNAKAYHFSLKRRQKFCLISLIKKFNKFLGHQKGETPKKESLLLRHNATQMFSSRDHPKPGLLFDLGYDGGGHGRGVLEESRIPFVPNFPNRDHDEGRHHLLLMSRNECYTFPPILDCVDVRPTLHMKLGWSYPNLYRVPNPHELVVLEQEMRCGLQFSLIWLHTPLFGHPLSCKQSDVQILFLITNHAKNLHFGGAQLYQTIGFIVVTMELSNCNL